ncbi:hypothetical protein DIPPA_12208 [Diplonema papillatum]|nr:hypothetical protein DIPPA_12208 [Diplonema papillatum]
MLSADFSKWGQLRKQTYAQKKEKDLRQQRVAARAKAGVLLSGRSDQPPTPELTEELRNNPLLRVEYCTALIVEGEKPLTDEFAVAPSDLAGLLREAALFKTYCRTCWMSTRMRRGSGICRSTSASQSRAI